MVTSTITKTAQDYLTAFNAHDWNRLSSFYTDDCTIEDVGSGMTYHGKQEFKKFYDNLYQTTPDLKMKFTNDFRSGDWGATEYVMTGTNTGTWPAMGNMPEMPATNKKYSIRGVTINHFRNNKIIHSTEYWNMADYFMQLGMMPMSK